MGRTRLSLGRQQVHQNAFVEFPPFHNVLRKLLCGFWLLKWTCEVESRFNIKGRNVDISLSCTETYDEREGEMCLIKDATLARVILPRCQMKVSIQHGWKDTARGKQKYREDSLSQCQFVHCVVITCCSLNWNVCATTGHKKSLRNVVSYIY